MMLFLDSLEDDNTVIILAEHSISDIIMLHRLVTGQPIKSNSSNSIILPELLFKELQIDMSSDIISQHSLEQSTKESINQPNNPQSPQIKMESEFFLENVDIEDDDDAANDDLDVNDGELDHKSLQKKGTNLTRETFEDSLELENKENISYPCDRCEKVSVSELGLKNHIRRMHIIHDEFKCDNCDESFRRIDSLKRHIRKIHTNNEKIKCDSCDQNFRRKESLKQHMKTCSVNEPLLDEEQAQPVKPLRKGNRCHLCKLPVNTFRKHYKLKHSSVPGQMVHEYKQFLAFNNLDFLCTVCKKSFQSAKNLRIHTRIKHTEYTGTFPCDTCGREFQQIITLKKHIFNFHSENLTSCVNTAGDEKSFICDLCAKVFKSDEDLKIHMWIHSKSFKCRVENCFEEFPRKTAYIQHMLLKHKVVIKLNKPKSIKDGPTPEVESPHLCSECGDSFRSKKGLTDHAKSVHSKEFMCHICNTACKRKVALELHIAKHGPPTIKCHQCDKLFYTNYNMRRHIITMHVDNSQKPYKCSICPKGFESAKNLEGHLNMHNGLKPYICEICGKGFQNASNRRAHVKKLHTAVQN